MKIKNIDHIVLTVKDIQTTIDFYVDTLNMKKEIFSNNRFALKFGNQKINLHQLDTNITPKAKHPTFGSYDLCFIIETPLEIVYQNLKNKKIKIIEDIVSRTGANGMIKSLYIYDPDENLIELSNYMNEQG
jgi:catechol 2,3-dioxygenase-like lactoylglutathione lyase family enzyme